MKQALIIKSSIRGEQSISSQLADAVAAKLKAQGDFLVTARDVTSSPVPILDGAILGSWFTPEDQRSKEQQALVALSDALVAELKNTDLLVLASGMHNFTIPTQLKNYLDQVVRAGQTFQYTATGPQGLLKNKRAIILVATGGDYSADAARGMDFQAPYLKQVLGFIGITDVTIIRVGGQSMGEDAAKAGLAKALEEVGALAL